MTRRRLLLFALLAALAFGLAWVKLSRYQPAESTLPPEPASRPEPAETAQPAATTPSAQPDAEVAIEDGKTIDFSSGHAEVRNEDADRAALEKALAEIKAVEAETTLAPLKPAK